MVLYCHEYLLCISDLIFITLLLADQVLRPSRPSYDGFTDEAYGGHKEAELYAPPGGR